MKVLHVIPSVGPLRGGPSAVIRTVTRGLAERGVETHIATTNDNGPQQLDAPLARPVVIDGVSYWYFPRQSRFYLVSLPLTQWLWRHVTDYDLIHIHFLFSFCPNAAAWIARRKGVPYIIRPLGVLNRWGMQNRRPWLKRMSFAVIEKPLLTGAAAVHYTAEQERAEASELCFRHTPVIIPNPIDILPAPHDDVKGRFRATRPELGSRPIVLFLSRIDHKKGLDLLIPAFAAVLAKGSDAVLVIAGDGDRELADSLRQQVRNLGIDRSVIWTGFLNGTEKLSAFADADVFVLPSYSENFGIAIVEAMATGVPVIITDQVGIHTEVNEHKAGLVVTPAVDSLTAALDKLLSDRQLRRALGQNGITLVRSRFCTDTVLTTLVDTYRRILSESDCNHSSPEARMERPDTTPN